MISFFKTQSQNIIAVQSHSALSHEEINRLNWLFGNSELLDETQINERFVGPRRELITPWSTGAVEITQNMGIEGVLRIEEYFSSDASQEHDPMLQQVYKELNQEMFDIDIEPEQLYLIDDIAAYNEDEGLALSEDEIDYLEGLSKKLDRKLTDSEVFGFSQVNSEH